MADELPIVRRLRNVSEYRSIPEMKLAVDLICALRDERDELRDVAKWLVEQADKCGFVDDHGHKLTMNKAFCDLRAALAKGGEDD